MNYNKEKFERKSSPRDTSGILSKLLFLYNFEYLRKGFRKDLEEEDLCKAPANSQSKKLGDRLERNYKFSFRSLFLESYGKMYILYGLALFIPVAVKTIRPNFIGKYVSYFIPGQINTSESDAWVYGAIVIGLNFVESFCWHHYSMETAALSFRARSAVSSLIYRKILKLDSKQLQQITTGKILTLITTDVATIRLVVKLFNHAWTGIINIIAICLILSMRLGFDSLLAMIPFFCLVICTQMVALYLASKAQVRTCKNTDSRLGFVQEALSTIKTVKMYVLEKFFERKIRAARKREITLQYKVNFGFLFNTVGMEFASNVTFFFLVLSLVWMNKKLAAADMFVLISSFQTISFKLQTWIPFAAYHFAKFLGSLNRLDETINEMSTNCKEPEEKTFFGPPRILMKMVTVTMVSRNILDNVNLEIDEGLNIISGNNASGKSVLLKTILKDCKIDSGELIVNGSISYASQEPWIFPSTIRQNIIFVEKFDAKRYNKVLEVCDLIQDLEMLPDRDLTIVTDRAQNLSKGQQARINLARAVYKKSDIYLLDECFSSLDPTVVDYIHRECILKFLENKIVILVSNNEKFHEKCYGIYNLDRNKIDFSISKPREPDSIQDNLEPKILPEICEYSKVEPLEETKPLLEPTKSVYKEIKKTGSVHFRTYFEYARYSGGLIFFIFILMGYILAQVIMSYKEKFISHWVDVEIKFMNNSTNSTAFEETNRMHSIHGAFIITLGVAIFCRTFFLFLWTRKGSLQLHQHLTKAILNAKVRFFDRNYLGNILNRFSKDFDVIDEHIPYALFQFTWSLCEVVGVIALIASVNSIFLLPSSILLVVMILLRYFYIPTGRSLKRLEASTRSPVVGYIEATINGATTIKAYKAEKVLIEEFDEYQDLYMSASYLLESTKRFFILSVDILCMIFIASVVIRFLIWSEGVLVGEVGLAISQACTLIFKQQWAILQWAEIENHMTSVERVLEYVDVKEEEKNGLVLENFPKAGKIAYEQVSMSFGEMKVLKNVNFTIAQGEKIAIVGRTGAGKSSLISALFRLYDFDGRIKIDGEDIKLLSLDFLRKSISVVPQNPSFFRGTVRENLDPYQQHNDEEIWKVLGIVGLKTVQNLTEEVRNDDLKFSIGYRQLFAFARVLLQKNRIIVFDEPVENMDLESELLIRKIIKEHFYEHTLITIAHKLNFIMDFNRIIVLEHGSIVEFDRPSKLLADKNGYFFQMAKTAKII